MDGEPCGALPPVRRHHEDGIGGERHRDAVGDPDHPHVDAVLGTDEHVVVTGTESSQDDLLEQLGCGLPGPLLPGGCTHARRSS